MILLIDNYDSFTYNLYQYIGEMQPDIRVVRNDCLTVEQAADLQPDHIVLSPGPGVPSKAGICEELIRWLGPDIPILGVCLGHQAIGEAFGGHIIHASQLMHGKADTITLECTCPLFAGLPAQIEVGRYHSLAVEEETLPAVLNVTARSGDGCIMGLQHTQYPVYGIQFHPESILTPEGKAILRNFLGL